ncbi:MAG TPA: flagellar motor protein MotB [Caproiciproducens sp.]|nr:flagellar motor protein MotB [Caproiciproducens sp.]
MKKKASENEKEGNSERWLLTYSDMITLLLALFIILYSMSTIDAKKTAKVAQQFANALGTGTSASAGAGKGTGSGSGTGTGSGTGNGTGAQMDALDQVYDILQKYVDKNNLQSSIDLDNTDNYVKIHLNNVLMFKPDSAEMLPASQPVLKEIAGAISQVYDRVDHITISGHTADTGERSLATDQVSWRLSTERAVTVLTSLVGDGMQQDKLSIEGYGYFNPIASNNNETGRAKNRRVEITIYKYPAVDKSPAKKSTGSAASGSASSGSGDTASSKMETSFATGVISSNIPASSSEASASSAP